MYYNKGGSLWYPWELKSKYFMIPLSSVRLLHQITFPITHNLLRERWHTTGAPVHAASWEIQLTCPTKENRDGGKRTTGVIQYHGGHFHNLCVELFFKYSFSPWKMNLLNFFLNKICQMLVINPARKNSGSSKNLLTYYMRGRFTGRGAGIGRSTVLAGSPVEHLFHPCDWAEAVALYNPHVTTTANSVSHPAYINVIFLLFSTAFTPEAALLFCIQPSASWSAQLSQPCTIHRNSLPCPYHSC